MKTSKQIAIFTILFVILVVAVVVYVQRGDLSEPENDDQVNQELATQPENYSASGRIVGIDDGKIVIEIPVFRSLNEGDIPSLVNERRTVIVTSKTRTTQWVNSNGVITAREVDTAALRMNQEVTVFTGSDPVHSTQFTADKIEINP